jgi:hypothetical protein
MLLAGIDMRYTSMQRTLLILTLDILVEQLGVRPIVVE